MVRIQRRAIESTYYDTCTVYSFEKTKTGGITSQTKVILYENKKCALSQKASGVKPTTQTGTTNNISYDAKLFIAPELAIEPGSCIEVTRHGRTYSFQTSGVPFIYDTHQEILLLETGRA